MTCDQKSITPIFVLQGSRVTMNEQIALFVSTLRIQLPLLIKNQGALSKYIADSLFMINIGSNDYINNYLLPLLYNSKSIYSSDAFAKLLINNLSRQLSVIISSKLIAKPLYLLLLLLLFFKNSFQTLLQLFVIDIFYRVCTGWELENLWLQGWGHLGAYQVN